MDYNDYWQIARPAIKAGLITEAVAQGIAGQHKPHGSSNIYWGTKIARLTATIEDAKKAQTNKPAGLPDWRDEANPMGIFDLTVWSLYRALVRDHSLNRADARKIAGGKEDLEKAALELENLGLANITWDRFGVKAMTLKEKHDEDPGD